MYVAIRRAKGDPAAVDEVKRRVQEGFGPLILGLEGFKEYLLLDLGNGELMAISVFEDQAGAEASNRHAYQWVRDNLAGLLTTPLEVRVGEVKYHQTR